MIHPPLRTGLYAPPLCNPPGGFYIPHQPKVPPFPRSAGISGNPAALGEGEEGLERQRHLIEKLRI